jgi:DNA-binding SARP family transcriptional activator/tetratricopeptide (TPR) repeat protein
VLAALLLGEGRVVGVDVLLRAVWGEDLPDTAAATLQTYVSRLRRALGPTGHELLRREVAGYRLVLQPGALDATRFRELAAQGSAALHADEPARAVSLLRSALALWRGEVLEDLGPDAGGAVGARWGEQRRTAEEDLLDAELRCSPAGGVVPALVDAVRTAPLRERRRGLLALALYRDGRQAEALAVLEEGRRLLADELGLDPSPALRALQARILDHDPDLVAARPPVAPVPRQRVAAEPASRRSLVGRRAELRVLDDVLDEVLSGAGCRHVVLEGEPGVGKTRLAQELCARAAARGATVLTSATLETGVSPAYGPWLQLLGAAAARGEVPGPAATVLEGDPRTAALGATPIAVASAVADSVAESVRLLAGSAGLVLLIDDLQWADPASLDLLARIGPRLSAAPVLVVTTVRHLEVSGDEAVVGALAQLSRASGTRRLTLRGLSLEESGELLAQTAGGAVDEDVVAALHARSEGNPFFTTELARLFVEEGHLGADAVSAAAVPTGVRDVLARRLSRLPEATQRLLETAAVLGREVDLELVSAVAGSPLEDCLDALEPALAHGLVEVPEAAPGALRFTHALVREALSAGLSSLRRARLHLRAAEAILAAVGDTDDTAEVVAEHLWQATAVGAGGQAARALERAAQVALRRQALESAESLLERAARLHRAAGTDGGLAELRVLRQLGFVGAALHGYAINAQSPLLRRARELARSTHRPDILLDLIWAQWAGCDTGGEPRRAAELVREAEQVVGDSTDPVLLGGMLSMRAFSHRHTADMARAEEDIAAALRLLDSVEPSTEAAFFLNGHITSLGFRHWVASLRGRLDWDAVERDYHAQDRPFGRIVVSLFACAAAMHLHDVPRLRVHSERMLSADPDMWMSFWSSSAELYSALSLLQRDRLEEGLALFDRGLLHIRESGGRTTVAGMLAEAVVELVRLGEQEAAEARWAEARVELDESEEQCYAPTVLLARAHVAAGRGDHDIVDRALAEAEALAQAHGSLGFLPRLARDRAALTGRPAHA